jgi:hypothetical protein
MMNLPEGTGPVFRPQYPCVYVFSFAFICIVEDVTAAEKSQCKEDIVPFSPADRRLHFIPVYLR